MTEASDELIKMTATEAVAHLRSKEVSPLDLVEASIKRIETVDKEVNALPIHCFDQARAQAESLDVERQAANPKSLCGLPIAVKDYNDLGGALTTYGSPIFANNVAQTSDATVRKLESNGAIAVAKSNVPEWAGGHTFNPVNGLTRNPWDLRKSAGGSSGWLPVTILVVVYARQLRLMGLLVCDLARAGYPVGHVCRLWIHFGLKDQWREMWTTWLLCSMPV